MSDEKPKKVRAYLRIDVTTGRRRRIGAKDPEAQKRRAENMANRRAPKPPAAPEAPKRRGRKKAEVPPHLETTTEKILHEWDRNAVGADLDAVKLMRSVQVRRSLAGRLAKIGCEDCQTAAEWFIDAWETVERGIRGQSIEMGVDGGGYGRTELAEAKLFAATVLSDIKARLGESDYNACVVYLCHAVNVSDIHAAGGHENRIVSDRIRRAVRALAHKGKGTEIDRTDAAIELLLRRASMGIA
jgi:hypothetical protein